MEYGLDKHYKDSRAVRNAVNKIYASAKKDPDKYGLSQEALDLIAAGMKHRSLTTTKTNAPSMAEQAIDNRDIGEVVSSVRDKVWQLIDKKLGRYTNSKKKLDQISFKELGVMAGISFDKSQILQGKATENIAVLAKIDENLSPQQLLELALKAREQTVATKK